jgi:hypothetical protein
MAFITSNAQVISFAEYADVAEIDQRVFEANEGLSEDVVEDATIRSTERILYLIRNTDWWKSYYIRQSSAAGQSINDIFTSGLISVPLPDADNILTRQNDFTDLCCYYALSEYLLPKVADFSAQDNAEVRKIGVYNEKFRKLFDELIQDGAWYDFSGNGTITPAEKMPTVTNLRRIR